MPIVLYDGDCALCASMARLIVRHDPEARFRFALQRSEVGRRLLAAHGAEDEVCRSLVLLDDGRAHVRSEALLRIAAQLPGPLRWLALLRAVPQPVRQVCDDVASVVRDLTGRPGPCAPPGGDLAGRSLDEDAPLLAPVGTPAGTRSAG